MHKEMCSCGFFAIRRIDTGQRKKFKVPYQTTKSVAPMMFPVKVMRLASDRMCKRCYDKSKGRYI